MALGALIVAALFAWNVSRLWFLSDDAFISFRYARNLAEGLGPVWNAGERVEGYTNFSWVLLMATGMKLGIEPEQLSNALGVTCGALLLVAVFRFAARGRAPSSPWPWLLVLVLATNRSFAAWCTGGLETMLFTLLVFLGFARMLAQAELGRERARAEPHETNPREWGTRDALVSSACFAGAALTRPEGVLFGALAFALLAFEVVRRRRTMRSALVWSAPFCLLVGAHLLWRHAYYGAWLPNTFTAKVGGLWVEQGWRYLSYFHAGYRIGWFLPLVAFALLGPRRRDAAALGCVLLVYGAYVLAIGGDLFELRFGVHVFPLLYWLLVEGLATLAGYARRRTRAAGPLVGAAGALVLLVATHLGYGRVPGDAFGVQTVESLTRYTSTRIDQGQTLRRFIDSGTLPRDLVLCVGGAGAVPYYTRWTTVDRRGLNDARIARTPIREHGIVGHEHDAPHEYLVERKVVVFDCFNQLLFESEGLRSRTGAYQHDGHPLALRGIALDERALVFATYVSDDELARRFPGLEILRLGTE